MSDLLMIVPSRERAQNVADLIAAMAETRTMSARLLVAVDNDDSELDAYRLCVPSEGAELVVGPRERLGPTLNRLAVQHAPDYFAIGFMGDDHRPRTKGWDERMVAALREMGSGIVYGNDLFQGANLPTAVVMTSDIVRALGWFCPPGLVHMYLDNSWKMLGEALGRLAYLPDVVIEHLHPIAGTAEWDDGYREVNSQEMYARDRETFNRWLAEDFESDIERIEEAIGAPCG